MTRSDIADLVELILAAYPAQRQRFAAADVRRMVDAFEAGLGDLDVERVKLAAQRLVRTTKWLPSVAEIREAVLEVDHGPRRVGAEAWGDVVAAIRTWGAYQHERVTFDDPLVADVVRMLGWRELCLSEGSAAIAADRARFVDTYDLLARRERTEIAATAGATAKRLPASQGAERAYTPQIGRGERHGQARALPGDASEPAPAPRIGKPFLLSQLRRHGMVLVRRCNFCGHVDRQHPDTETPKCGSCGEEANPVQHWTCDGDHVPPACVDPECWRCDERPKEEIPL